MVARSGLFVAPASGVGTAPVDARLAVAGMIGTATPQTVSGGAITQSASTMQFTIAPAVLELPDPTNAAAAFISPIDQTILTPAVGPTTGSRVDLIVAKQNDPQNADPDARANFSLIAGVPGAPGVAPAVPAGYLRYADIGVPTNAANAAACTVTLRSPTSFTPPWLQAPTLALLNTVTGQPSQHATVTSDTTAVNNTDYRWNGSSWVRLVPLVTAGLASVTTDASGLANITHGLGATPSRVTLTPVYTSNVVSSVFRPTVGALTSTTFQLVAFRTDTSARLASTAVQFYWEAWL